MKEIKHYFGGAMMQNILFEIQDKLPGMTSVEQKLGNYILNHSRQVLSMSAQTLAKESNTSPATAIRFAKKLGLEGFTQLKLLISANLSSVDTGRTAEFAEDDSVNDIKEKMKTRMNYMVDQTNDLLDDKAIEGAALIIHQAETIFVYGIGASSLVAQDIFQKFTRIGKRVIQTQDLHMFLTSMVTLGDKGVLIAVSNSGENSDLRKLIKSPNVSGMPIIAITRNKKSTLAKSSDFVLISSSGENLPLRSAATISLMAQLYVVDILFYAFASHQYEETEKMIQKTREAVKQIDKI
ncbi:MAG: MurR/RpiR family transcriptional regulator [Lactobacillales bacterium]|jgi:DNA-binding MurR/RpiR family transcriptional regulator|nr:MurR/RpiR family transcriptional regulator [Lactobacillales bacterium]